MQRTECLECLRWHLSLPKPPINRPQKSVRSWEFHTNTDALHRHAHSQRIRFLTRGVLSRELLQIQNNL